MLLPYYRVASPLSPKRQQNREAFVDMECTFQPNLTSNSIRGRRKGEGGEDGEEEDGSRLDALYNKGKLKQARPEEQAERKRDRQL